MNIRRTLIFVGAALLLGGCAVSPSLVDRNSQPSSTMGYVAGRFTQLQAGPNRTAFILNREGDSETEFLLPFTHELRASPGAREIELIQLQPGRYRVWRWTIFSPASSSGRLGTGGIFEGPLARWIDVPPAGVVFLGSFSSRSATRRQYPDLITNAEIEAQRITLSEAKAALSAAYPKFSELPLTCIACEQ
jgi:hypothetical protein